MLRLHQKLFDYSNRYFEIRAFSLSKLIYAQIKLTRTTSSTEIAVIQSNLKQFSDELYQRAELFNHFYCDSPEFARKELFNKVFDTMNQCINRLNDFIDCF
jgi:hypothetical protein